MPREQSEVDRLAVYFLNEYRAITGLEPVESLDLLSPFGREDWREKARRALAAARESKHLPLPALWRAHA